jgi:hypothetical protein
MHGYRSVEHRKHEEKEQKEANMKKPSMLCQFTQLLLERTTSG